MVNKTNKIIIFTDGASKGNPGPGGYGAIIIQNLNIKNKNEKRGEQEMQKVRELGGREEHTTNNRMELTGALKALEKIKKEKGEIIVYTDSKYLIGGMTGWIYGWQKNDWKKKKVLADGTVELSDVLNQDLWKKLAELAKPHSANSSDGAGKISWHYVGGHVGVAGNERCDEIASAFAKGEKLALYSGPLSGYKIDIFNLGHDEVKKENKITKSQKSNAKAYSYVSLVDGVVYKDKIWAECEKRVKGKSGVKYKKSISESDEKEILRSWGVNE